MKIKPQTEHITFDSLYTPPGDKSISHRSIFFSALSNQNVKVENFLFSEDCLRTLEIFRSLGVRIEILKQEILEVSGVGLKGLKGSSQPLYCGNSGTTARLLIGLLSAQNFTSMITGDSSLSRRPMARVTHPLRLMGAKIEGKDNANYLPLQIKGTVLKGIEYNSPVASAQVKSALLIAGLYARNKTVVIEPFKSRDHTEKILRAFGVKIITEGFRVEIFPPEKILAKDIFIPGDISSAAYFIALCLLSKDSRLIIKNVGLNSTRLGFLRVVKRMNANLEVIYKVREEDSPIFEPSGDIIIHSSRLKGTVVKKNEIPSLIDELPVLFLLASLADGDTYIEGVSELRVKETDRVNSLVTNLGNMGVEIEILGEDIRVKGRKGLKAAGLKSFSDHRTAMTAAVAAVLARGDSTIDNLECVEISYPNFLKDLKKILGTNVKFEI